MDTFLIGDGDDDRNENGESKIKISEDLLVPNYTYQLMTLIDLLEGLIRVKTDLMIQRALMQVLINHPPKRR